MPDDFFAAISCVRVWMIIYICCCHSLAGTCYFRVSSWVQTLLMLVRHECMRARTHTHTHTHAHAHTPAVHLHNMHCVAGYATVCCLQEWGLYADMRVSHQDVLDAQMNDLEVCGRLLHHPSCQVYLHVFDASKCMHAHVHMDGSGKCSGSAEHLDAVEHTYIGTCM